MLRYGSVQQSKLLMALKHNKRELQAELETKPNIDASKTRHNYFLHSLGTAESTYNFAMSELALAGIHKIRKNAVLAIECIFSLPGTWQARDYKSFFEDCMAWISENFEGTLLTFDVHLDESAIHAHALILPILEGKLQGDRIKGGKAQIAIRQKSFYESVGIKYGFKNPLEKRLTFAAKRATAKKVMDALKGDPVYQSKVFAWFRDAVFSNPIGCAQILGIPIDNSQRKLKHFVDHKRSRGHGTFEK